jgi:hypothetical protein
MQTVENASGSTRRMSAYRSRLRAAGLRPVQIWVPDVRSPRLAEEASRQSLLAAGQAEEAGTLAFIEHTADTGDSQ